MGEKLDTSGKLILDANGKIKPCCCDDGSDPPPYWLYLETYCDTFPCDDPRARNFKVDPREIANGTTTWEDIYLTTAPDCPLVLALDECFTLCLLPRRDCIECVDGVPTAGHVCDYPIYRGGGTQAGDYLDCPPCACCNKIALILPCASVDDPEYTCIECGRTWSWESESYGTSTLTLSAEYMAYAGGDTEPPYCWPSDGIPDRRYRSTAYSGRSECQREGGGLNSANVCYLSVNQIRSRQEEWHGNNTGDPSEWCRYVVDDYTYNDPLADGVTPMNGCPYCILPDTGTCGLVEFLTYAGGWLHEPLLSGLYAATGNFHGCSGSVTVGTILTNGMIETYSWDVEQTNSGLFIDISCTTQAYTVGPGGSTILYGTYQIDWHYVWQLRRLVPCQPQDGCDGVDPLSLVGIS